MISSNGSMLKIKDNSSNYHYVSLKDVICIEEDDKDKSLMTYSFKKNMPPVQVNLSVQELYEFIKNKSNKFVFIDSEIDDSDHCCPAYIFNTTKIISIHPDLSADDKNPHSSIIFKGQKRTKHFVLNVNSLIEKIPMSYLKHKS